MLGLDEGAVEQLARGNRAQRQQRQRDQDRPRAFVRMIARGAFLDLHVMVGRAVMVGGDFARVLMHMMDGVLDMLAARPAGLAEEGQEDQPPAVEAGQQRGEGADEEGDVAVRRCPLAKALSRIASLEK